MPTVFVRCTRRSQKPRRSSNPMATRAQKSLLQFCEIISGKRRASTFSYQSDSTSLLARSVVRVRISGQAKKRVGMCSSEMLLERGFLLSREARCSILVHEPRILSAGENPLEYVLGRSWCARRSTGAFAYNTARLTAPFTQRCHVSCTRALLPRTRRESDQTSACQATVAAFSLVCFHWMSVARRWQRVALVVGASQLEGVAQRPLHRARSALAHTLLQ